MCGIFFCVCRDGDNCYEHLDQCQELLSHRGPDCQTVLESRSTGTGHNIGACSTVLWLQGDSVQHQPVIDSHGNMLLWNGDIFDVENQTRDLSESDTTFLSRMLSKCSSSEDITGFISLVQGPWSLVYYQSRSQTVWFGRDFFGRQSLLISKTEDSLTLCSCITNKMTNYQELPALGLYSCKLSEDGQFDQLQLYPWDSINVDQNKLESLNCEILSESIKCPVMVKSKIDLFPMDDCGSKEQELFDNLLGISDISKYVLNLEIILEDAVRTRLLHQPNLCKDCVFTTSGDQECPHEAVGILFSGGLDCCVLAGLAAKMTPSSKPLHLYNVAFQQSNGGYEVPDRITGLQAFSEIKQLYPDQDISLILVNVTLEELQRERARIVKDLLHPLETVLDDSIGCAIWFAARGRGVDSVTGDPVASRARVLILGMGIDEQLGGYSKHRARFNKESWEGLADELRQELVNISSRNLGRDNRIVSDHGVAPRFPYLDEKFVNFLSTVPINLKCDFAHDRGVGEKLILRLLAFKLGLRLTSKEPKRAIQFGSRIAKMEKRKEKGNQKAIRL